MIPTTQEFGQKIVSVPETKNSSRLRTIPATNLGIRKQAVLKIHKENLQMVTRLAEMKCNQELLVPDTNASQFGTIGT